MPTIETRRRPALEALENRRALSTGATAIPPGDTLTVLTEFTKYYPSVVGEPNYNPAFDVNHNGQIGQTDGRILLHALPPISPKIPLILEVALAPADQVHGHHPTNLGGTTYSKDPTVIGHTTPGALIFTGNGVADLKLRGPAVVANAQGNFSLKMPLSTGLNEFDLQANDPFGQQTLRAFPILWLGFAKYEADHPTND